MNDLEFDLDKVERKNANNVFWNLQILRKKMIYVDKSLHEMHTEAKIMTSDPGLTPHIPVSARRYGALLLQNITSFTLVVKFENGGLHATEEILSAKGPFQPDGRPYF